MSVDRVSSTAAILLRRSPLCRQFHSSRRLAPVLFAQRLPENGVRAVVGVRGFASQSASAAASLDSNAFEPNPKSPSVAETLAVADTASSTPRDLLVMLEKSIADRQPSQALAYYQCLQTPPSTLTSQKLAILLAKQDSLHQTRRAHEILQAVYGAPAFAVDDYTQLASIFVVDACVRQKMLDEAIEIFDRAHGVDISLDLSAYDGLLRALVNGDQIERAREVLTEILSKKLVVLQEQTFQPLLIKLMEAGKYGHVLDTIDLGRKNGVNFTFDTYDLLVELGEELDESEVEESWDVLERLMTYINNSILEDGLAVLEEDDDEDDNITVEVGYDDDDDDDFDDNQY